MIISSSVGCMSSPVVSVELGSSTCSASDSEGVGRYDSVLEVVVLTFLLKEAIRSSEVSSLQDVLLSILQSVVLIEVCFDNSLLF